MTETLTARDVCPKCKLFLWHYLNARHIFNATEQGFETACPRCNTPLRVSVLMQPVFVLGVEKNAPQANA